MFSKLVKNLKKSNMYVVIASSTRNNLFLPLGVFRDVEKARLEVARFKEENISANDPIMVEIYPCSSDEIDDYFVKFLKVIG